MPTADNGFSPLDVLRAQERAINAPNPDCQALWKALGRTIQAARLAADSEASDRNDKWATRDWSELVNLTKDNIWEATDRLNDRGCVPDRGGIMELQPIRQPVDDRAFGSPVAVHDALQAAESAFWKAAPSGLSIDVDNLAVRETDRDSDGHRYDPSGDYNPPGQTNSIAMQQMADDWEILSGQRHPGRERDCEDIWLALGATIQVAREAARETAQDNPHPEWRVDDWEMFLERAWDNIEAGVETLDKEDCIDLDGVGVLVGGLPSAFEEVRGPEHAVKVFENVEAGWRSQVPGPIAEEMRERDTSDGIDHGTSDDDGSFRMVCAEGDSLSEVEMAMNDELNDGGEPESLTVDRDESLDSYYACALLRQVANDVRGD